MTAFIAHTMDKFSIDKVYHCAAIPNVAQCETNRLDALDANYTYTIAVVEAMKMTINEPHLHFLSTVVVHSNLQLLDFKNSHHINDDGPSTFYGYTKLLSENYIKDNYKKHSIYRLCAQIGPGSTHGLVHDIIKKLKSTSENLELLGSDPGSIKPYTSVREVASIIAKNNALGTFYVTPDDSMSVRDIATFIMDYLQIHKPIVFINKNFPNDIPFIKVDLTYRFGVNILTSSLYKYTTQESIKMGLDDIQHGK
jgi:nucleoside-diphosphate-sugar epimerase